MIEQKDKRRYVSEKNTFNDQKLKRKRDKSVTRVIYCFNSLIKSMITNQGLRLCRGPVSHPVKWVACTRRTAVQGYITPHTCQMGLLAWLG